MGVILCSYSTPMCCFKCNYVFHFPISMSWQNSRIVMMLSCFNVDVVYGKLCARYDWVDLVFHNQFLCYSLKVMNSFLGSIEFGY